MSFTRDRGLALAWAVLLVVVLAPIGWGAHQPYSWDADNIAPGSVLKGIAAHFGPGWHSSYGPLPYLLTAILYLPLLAVMRLSGELGIPSAEYPWGFAHPDLSIAILIIAARLLTAAMALGIAWFAARESIPAHAPRRAWLAPLLLAGSAAFVYYSRTSNVDMAYLFWLWAGLHMTEGLAPPPRRLAAAAAAAALAVCSKEQSAPIAVVIILAATIRAWRLAPGAATRRAGAALGVVMAAVAAYALAWGLPWNLAGWRAHHDFIFHVARYDRAYPATPAGFLELARATLPLFPVALGWSALAGIGLAILFRANLAGLGLRAFAVSLYAAGFLAPIGYVYPRFLLPLLLLALPVALRGWSAAWDALGRSSAGAGALGLALGLLVMTGGPNLDSLQLADTRAAAGRWLERHVRAGALVEIAGNPRFQARPPRAATALYTPFDSLRLAPRGPRGDVVLHSSIDVWYFQTDSVVRAAWWDSLAGPAATRYGLPVMFKPSTRTRLAWGLFVSPTLWIYTRADSGRGTGPR